jgi:hypothetical protein
MQRQVIVLTVLVVLALVAGPSAAQEATMERQETDATVRVELGTTGNTVRAERVRIREVGAVPTTLAEASDVDGEITFEDLKVLNFKPLIVSAWVADVAYHAKVDGQHFLDGRPAVVYAFEQTDDLAGLTITGMNVVVRDRESGFELEYIVTVDNQSRPQRTVKAAALPVRLALPSSLRGIEVEVDNGPDPLTAPLRSADGGMRGVATALPPGEARVSLRGVVAAEDRLAFTVATNLPVEQWSLLAWPASLEVRSFDLELDDTNTYAEFSRWRGEPLEPGDEVDVTVSEPTEA